MLKRLFSERNQKFKIYDVSQVNNINNIKILAIRYNFINNNIYSIKINNYKTNNSTATSTTAIYAINTIINKIPKSNLNNNYSLNINYLDTSIFKNTQLILIISNFSFSLQNIFINLISSQDLLKDSKNLKILNIPDVNIHKNNITRNYQVGCILDSFTHRCLSYELNLIPISYNNFLQELINTKIDFFIFESAWHGNNCEWSNKLINYDNTDKNNKLTILINYLDSNNIPKILYNKEDPINFDYFKNLAACFDKPNNKIITTDISCINKYKALNITNVDSFGFCCQPIIHNPVSFTNDLLNIIFPCAYYGFKYPERCKEMISMIDKYYNLVDIYDRQLIFNKQSYQVKNLFNTQNWFEFPKQYNNLIKGSLEYDQVLYLYKKYKLVMNANTITDSETMFSRRVIEAGSCGACVVSNNSVGMNKLLDGVVDYNNKDSVMKLLEDNEFRLKTSSSLYTKIMSNFTYKKLVDKFTENIIEKKDIIENNKICCLVFCEEAEIKEEKEEEIKEKEEEIKEIKEEIKKEIKAEIKTVIKNYNYVINLKDLNLIYDYYVIININNITKYHENYINNMLLPILYTDADIISKSNNLNLNHTFTNDLNLNNLVISNKIMKEVFQDNNINLFWNNIKNYIENKFNNTNMYAVSKYN